MVETFQRHTRLLGECFWKLRESSMAVVGVGGLGSTAAQLLVRTGVKRLVLIDDGVVDEPDLNRQLLYTPQDVGRKKVEVAAEKLSIFEKAEIIPIFGKVEDVEIPDVDVALDCLDSFSTRFILEDKIWKKGIPMVHGGVKGYAGQVTVIYPHKTKRLRDIFGDVEDDPHPPQVFPPVVSLIASIQTSEAVKLICGDEEGSLMNRLLIVDLSISSFDVLYLS